ncbi:hypothetical protein H4R26_005830 [Coemansia thaxteri]|uniref:LITAF domain-containing protein n=1 Tax=Coemansia thaxteri TaxID=2663907 RepID=A0A9W8B9Y0_9FUNG|nr:hypothetical protein H4R26_005830 [Coemansia thaxteri]
MEVTTEAMEEATVEANMADMAEANMEAITEVIMEQHGRQNKYSKSSVFVPNDWDFKSTKGGMTELISRVAQQIDKQFIGSEYGGGGHGSVHGSKYGKGSKSHKGMHDSMVSVAHDPFGMFMPGGLGFMNRHDGHARVGKKSVPTICPRCDKQVITLVKRRPDSTNVIATVGAVALGVIFKMPKTLLPLALLPMQLKSLHKTTHYCPRCNFKLGKHIKISIPVD